MGLCVALREERGPNNEKLKCEKQTSPGYKYCDEHKSRKWAVQEREQKALGTLVDATEKFTGFVVDEKPPEDEVVRKEEPKSQVVARKQQNIYDKVDGVLDRALEWEERTWKKLNELPETEWRYIDKTGAEQLRSEIAVNERAQDRTIRAVTAIAKLGIDAQAVNVNKMIRELVKGVVMKVLVRLELEQQQIDQARLYLAEEFEKVSQETASN